MANEIEYVTPDILRTELEAQDRRFDAKLQTMLAMITNKLAEHDRRFDAVFDELRETRADLARHAKAIEESVRSQIAALDDKYRDLPGRVERLEQQPPPAAPKRRAQRR